MIVSGDEVNGILDGWDNARVTLRRQSVAPSVWGAGGRGYPTKVG